MPGDEGGSQAGPGTAGLAALLPDWGLGQLATEGLGLPPLNAVPRSALDGRQGGRSSGPRGSQATSQPGCVGSYWGLSSASRRPQLTAITGFPVSLFKSVNSFRTLVSACGAGEGQSPWGKGSPPSDGDTAEWAVALMAAGWPAWCLCGRH